MGDTSMRLGELLVSKGLLKDWQLQTALQEQGSTKDFLGAILVRKGWVTEEQLLKALGEQMDMPYVRLEAEPVDSALAKWFPLALLKEHDCVPVRVAAQTVMVAIANPLDVWAVSELERGIRARGYRVQLVLANMKDIRSILQRLQQQALKSVGGGSGGLP